MTPEVTESLPVSVLVALAALREALNEATDVDGHQMLGGEAHGIVFENLIALDELEEALNLEPDLELDDDVEAADPIPRAKPLEPLPERPKQTPVLLMTLTPW
jgi:hypothetical protein